MRARNLCVAVSTTGRGCCLSCSISLTTIPPCALRFESLPEPPFRHRNDHDGWVPTVHPMTEPTTTVPNFAAPPVKDFTRKRERIVFRIDDDLFEAATAIPDDMLTEFATRYADIGDVPVAQQHIGRTHD